MHLTFPKKWCITRIHQTKKTERIESRTHYMSFSVCCKTLNFYTLGC